MTIFPGYDILIPGNKINKKQTRDNHRPTGELEGSSKRNKMIAILGRKDLI